MARVAHRVELIALLQEQTLRHGAAHWVALFEQAGVPCGPINDVRQVFEDPQVVARGMRVQMAHPLAGQVALVANPIRLSATPVTYRHAPPLLGQHTRAVLRELLQLDEARIDALCAAGAIACLPEGEVAVHS